MSALPPYTTPDDDRWTPAFRAPEDAIILRKGVPVDVQNEDRFSPMNSFAFSPLGQNLLSADNAIFGLALIVLAKQKPELAAKIISGYMDNVTDLLNTIVESGKAHPITALNASTAYAVTAHRFGVITDSGYLKIADQTRSIIDKLIQIGFAGIAMDGLQVLAEGGKKSSPLRRLSEVGIAAAMRKT